MVCSRSRCRNLSNASFGHEGRLDIRLSLSLLCALTSSVPSLLVPITTTMILPPQCEYKNSSGPSWTTGSHRPAYSGTGCSSSVLGFVCLVLIY